MTSRTNQNIKAVVFDFGGVIEFYEGGHLLKDISDSLGVSLPEFRNIYFKFNHLANVENLKQEDMIIKVMSVFDKSKEKENEIREIIRNQESKIKINTELVSFFPLLQKQGLKVGIFSNSNSELRERLENYGLLEAVDTVVISGEIGFQKPHKEAFQVLFEKLNLRPEEVIFVDDTDKSLEKATEIGYTPILFKNNDRLKADFKNLGISLD